jgi:hypothetical protein
VALSLQSDALEPTRAELSGLSVGERFKRYMPVYGLPIIGVLLILLFSALFPDTFPTMANANALIDNKAIIALLSLAVLAPMAAGKIDLTIGFGIVLWHILVISLQLNYHMPWQVAVVIVLVLGAALGLINALLVEFAQIDASWRRSARAPLPTRSRCGTPAAGRSSGSFRMDFTRSMELTSGAFRSAPSTYWCCPSRSGSCSITFRSGASSMRSGPILVRRL